jgi:hypothetical protein
MSISIRLTPTPTLDENITQEAKMASRRLKWPFKKIINQALRLGLKKISEPVKRQPYKTQARPMGLRAPYQIDNIQKLLAQIEGEGSE